MMEKMRSTSFGEYLKTVRLEKGIRLSDISGRTRISRDTLEALEIAAHDGRLAAVPGIGERRAAAIRAGLAALLTRRGWRRQLLGGSPSVANLLDIDREYRQRSAAGKLPKIAPKRFNPEGIAWLPILHIDRDNWHFTALFSNTALAHELGRTDDWVVVYYYDSDHREGQNTIVTETSGAMKGERVVRGREAECRSLSLKRPKDRNQKNE